MHNDDDMHRPKRRAAHLEHSLLDDDDDVVLKLFRIEKTLLHLKRDAHKAEKRWQWTWLALGGAQLVIFAWLAFLTLSAAPTSPVVPPAEASKQEVAKTEAPAVTNNAPAMPQIDSTNPEVIALRQKADTGDAAAMLALALRIGAGDGIAADTTAALDWLRRAAIVGNTEAQYRLGLAYNEGKLVPADKILAARWFEAASASGMAAAAMQLGALYETGIDGAPDIAAAQGWYQQAQQMGAADASAALERLKPQPVTREMIRDIQNALQKQGFKQGRADGRMGNRTIAAIRAYQQKQGLPVDGKASYALWQRLAQ